MMPGGVLWPEYCLCGVSSFYYPNTFNINAPEMYYCKGIDKEGVLLYEYSQSAILHAPHFRWVVKLCITETLVYLRTRDVNKSRHCRTNKSAHWHSNSRTRQTWVNFGLARGGVKSSVELPFGSRDFIDAQYVCVCTYYVPLACYRGRLFKDTNPIPKL